MPWTYDPNVKRYRRPNGRFVDQETVIDWAYAYADASRDVVQTLTGYAFQGTLRVPDWQTAMRRAVKNQYINQYLAGRGGMEQMTQRDWGIIGRALRDQYQFLDGFAQDLADGVITEAQAKARARMYIEAGHAAFERGRAEAFGMPLLPAYPSDGQTICLTNCRCNWIIEEVRDNDGNLIGWNATWRLDLSPKVKHCTDCPSNAALWAPLFVPAGMTPSEARAWRAEEQDRMREARGDVEMAFFGETLHQKSEHQHCNGGHVHERM
jgi:hypothetical protein